MSDELAAQVERTARAIGVWMWKDAPEPTGTGPVWRIGHGYHLDLTIAELTRRPSGMWGNDSAWSVDVYTAALAILARGADPTAPRLVCEAAPRDDTARRWQADAQWRTLAEQEGAEVGAREHLAVMADALQQAGDPLGEWLALWLSGAPCKACEPGGRPGRVQSNWGPWFDCGACYTAGTALGAHTPAIIAALRRLAP